MGEILGSMKALMVLQEDVEINNRQCSLLYDMFNLAFDILSQEIKQNLKLEEKNTKWKPLEQPLKELHRVFKEGELYVRQCLDSKDNWWVRALILHNNTECVELHIQNLLCNFPNAIEAIETAGEISGLDLEDMKKRRIVLSNKYDKTWNDPKLFQWKYGKQYLVSQEICHRLGTVWKEDQWLLLETIKGNKRSNLFLLSKQEQQLSDLLMKKLNGEESLFPISILTGAKDYTVRRRLGGGSQYKEIQWLGESFSLRHFFGEGATLNSEIYTLFSLSHPNVIQYLCGFHDEEKKEYFLVMELMSKDLNSYIKEVCGPNAKRSRLPIPFSLPSAVDIMLQIARGMEYLHSLKVYHGDLTPSNVLLKPRSSTNSSSSSSSSSLEGGLGGYFQAKISGFGLTNIKTIPSRSSSPNQDETLPFIWHAPEVLAEQERPGTITYNKHKYSEKADVYSFGMLCFELLTGKVPFEDGHLQGDKMSRNIRAGERPLFPFALPKYLATMTKRCWQTDPNQRPTFSSLCRILRYVKRLIVMNPHLSHPEITPSVVQVDFCDIESVFMNKFSADHMTPISQIPFQIFSYRLAEKEKMSGGSINRDNKNWDSHSEVILSSHHVDQEAVNTGDGLFSPVRDTRSVCSEIPDKIRSFSVVNKVNGDTKSVVCLETPKKKVVPLRKSISINTAVGRSSSSVVLMQDARSVCSEISEKKPLRLKKSNTLPSFRLSDTRSICSDFPEKKGPDKKISLLTKSSSVRVSKDPGKLKGQRKGGTVLSSRGQSPRMTAERSPTVSERPCRCSKHRQVGHLTDSEIH